MTWEGWTTIAIVAGVLVALARNWAGDARRFISIGYYRAVPAAQLPAPGCDEKFHIPFGAGNWAFGHPENSPAAAFEPLAHLAADQSGPV